MKFFVLLLASVVTVSVQGGPAPSLNSPQGLLPFMSASGSKNCIQNGNACTPGGQQCCLSPIFSCQGNPQAGGANQCRVVPAHVVHIPLFRQIIRKMGITTQNPIQ